MENTQAKCPNCGATDIELNPITGKLRCNYCKTEFEEEKVAKYNENIEDLQGFNVERGAQDINNDVDTIVTLKCSGCGAEITINASETAQTQCPWCRNFLSINTQVPNGVIPDIILPFKTTREEAFAAMKEKADKKKSFMHPDFAKNLTIENVKGVYLPYMVVDVNAHGHFKGIGELNTRVRTYEDENGNEYYKYDYDVYAVEREFDIQIEGITQTADSGQLGKRTKATKENKADHILYSIMPFDTENAVGWNANYLKGYTLEKRDINVNDISENIALKAKDIARHKIIKDMPCDRGLNWKQQDFQILGQNWKAAYFPVWIYSHTQKHSNKEYVYYMAQNARTGETNYLLRPYWAKILGISALFAIIGSFLGGIGIIAALGLILSTTYAVTNVGKRHPYESETKSRLSNVIKKDEYKKHKKRKKNSSVKGKNSDLLEGKDEYDWKD